MNQPARLGALIAAFTLAIAGGSYLGSGEPRAASPHEFAFATAAVCPDSPQHFECSAIYVVNGDAVSPSLQAQDLNALPPGTLTVLTKIEPMTGVTWSPDGRQLAYLTINVAGTYPDFNKPTSYDLWVVNADGSGNRQVDKNVLEPDHRQHGVSFPRLTWTMYGRIVPDHSPVDLSVPRVDGAFVYGKSVSADGKLAVFNASWLDSGSICVTSGALDAGSRRCFGDGGFGTPVWKPY